MDPLSIIAVGAAIGGATGKFVEKAWDSGEKWLQTFFKDHGEVAKKSATDNSLDFLQELAQKVNNLENSMQVTKEQIDKAQNHPDFSALLQKALITSAQTDSNEKHKILAKIVSERLKSEPESILALGSKMACDAISYATTNQLFILGLAVNIFGIRPNPFPPIGMEESAFQGFMDFWLITRLFPYKNVQLRNIDLTHLESLSCLKYNQFVGRDLNVMFQTGTYKYDFEKMPEPEIKNALKRYWESGLQKIDLTTVGQIIGISVSDILTNTNTSYEGWE